MIQVTDVLLIPYGKENEYHNLLSNSLNRAGIRTIKGEASQHKIIGGKAPQQEIIKLFFPLLRYVFSKNIDIIHIAWTHPFFISTEFSKYDRINELFSLVRGLIFISNVIISKILGVKVVWTVHNKYNHEKHHVRVDVFISRLLSGVCDAITVKCDSAKQTILELFHIPDQSKVHMIPEGNYITAYENTVTRKAARAEINISEDDFLFVYFGMIRPYKGVRPLMRAFGKSDTDATLMIVGNPHNEDMRRDILQLSSKYENIQTVLKYVPNDEIQYYMNAADVVTLPYKDILTSGSVLLAMSFGRPVVAPSIGCIPELAGRDRNFLYDPTSKNGLSNALEEARSASDLEKRGTRNRERAELLSWDKVGNTTAKLYEEIQE